ncbi:ATP-binding protein [Metallumcola ferriviriculae]|uniref:ATP-binding protein n=1 Tax=Metallumcola ferriviriculae TaxID=3039180 RepID=A0AAU0UTZ7_9FIRM|nr:ATP-binding protein [Desulfitibacteraceae bacterium MK1]
MDDLSYLTFNRYQSEMLFQVVAERYERASIIVTTNLEFSSWTDLFENEMMVAALIDRLTFRSHILNMNVDESYRLQQTLLRKAGTNNNPDGIAELYFYGKESRCFLFRICDTNVDLLEREPTVLQ